MSVISVKNISKSFGEVQAVRDVSFDIAEGDIVGYIGPNGAGKTTTVRMLAGIITPENGSITIKDVNVVANPDGVKNITDTCRKTARYTKAFPQRSTCGSPGACITSRRSFQRNAQTCS